MDVWERAPYPVPNFEDLASSIQRQMTDYSARTNSTLPPEALHLFLSSWIKLYGLLCMEVLHQLDFAYTDLEPVFEENLQELCAMHNLTYEPPPPK